jgi:enterochelin esterase family protein
MIRPVALGLILTAGISVAQPNRSAAPQRPGPDEQYVLGPDSQPQPGVPEGKVMEFMLDDSKTYPGFKHAWWLYLPPGYDGKKALPVMVFQDGGGYVTRNGAWRVPVVLENLMAKKQLPMMAAIFVNPGDTPMKPGEPPRKRADGRRAPARNRSVEYDTVSDTYARFLLEEILPRARQHVVITDDPAGRGICGSSSGGICALSVAWHRPDQFRKVYSTVGSFTNIRGGNVFPDLVRKAETKPIRFFQQDGANDLTNQFGSWPEANKALAAAMTDKGYDHQFVFGEGVHSPKHGASILPYVLRWLWYDYPKN